MEVAMTTLDGIVRIWPIVAIGIALVAAPGSEAQAPPGPQEVAVIGLFVDPQGGTPTVVLEGKRDQRRFAMAIGHAEATGIAVPLQNLTPPRPLTHDLFLTLFGRLKVSVTRVVITDLRDNTFFATVHLASAGSPLELDSRPSDAIALAIRAKAPIYAEDRVFDKAARPSPDGAGQRI
jgi:bifunctional DNase/RNase